MAKNTSKLIVFDLDKTITKHDTYQYYIALALLVRPWRLWRVPILAWGVWLFVLKRRDNSWLKELFLDNIFSGLELRFLHKLNQLFIGFVLARLARPQALHEIKQHKLQQNKLVLLSASFDFYVSELGKKLGFDAVICTRAEIAEQKAGQPLSGRMLGANCHGSEKARRLMAFVAERPLNGQSIIAYGDSYSDRFIFEMADQAIAVCPDKRLRRWAEEHNISIYDWS